MTRGRSLGRSVRAVGADSSRTNVRSGQHTTLGAILRRHNEIVHPGDVQSGTARFVGLEHIEPGTGRRIGEGTIDLARMTGRKPRFKTGQIVYGYLRPYLNKVWIADFDGCSSVDQFAFEVDQTLARTGFIAAFLRSEVFLRRAVSVTTPGQLPRISIDEIESVELELPSIPEQERIAAWLTNGLDVASAARRAAVTRLGAAESLAAATLREVFDGADAAAWPTVPFGTLATLVNGRAYAQHELLDSGSPVIRIQNLNGGDRWYYSDLDLEPAKYCDNGDLLFAWSASFGPYWWRGPKAIFHYHIWRVENGPCLDRTFAYYLLTWITASIRSAGRGLAMLHMTKSGMEEWPVSVPAIADQRRIAAWLSEQYSAAEDVVARCREELDATEALSAALLRAVFNAIH